MSTSRKPAPDGLGTLIGAGARAVSEFTGMVLGVFAVQALVAFGAGLVIAQLLTSTFAERPLLDDAVDGDLVALIEIARGASTLATAAVCVIVATAILWIVLSWFLGGGVLAVLTERPRGRRETARVFGAGGASTFFVFLRVGLLSLALHLMLVLPALRIGASMAEDTLSEAMTLGDLFLGAVIAVGPALLVALLINTVLDYARAELTLRRPSHAGLGALRAVGRALVFVARRPVTLAHTLIGWAAFVGVSVIYAWAAHGHALLGVSGALTLFVLRQLLSLVRTGIKLGVIGGQVELGATRAPPPRQVVDNQ